MKNLRTAGFSQEQSETLAESISKGINDGAASKADIARVEIKLESRTNALFGIQMVILGYFAGWFFLKG